MKKQLMFLSLSLFFVTSTFASLKINTPVILNEPLFDTLSGKPIKLSDFKGKTVVLEWFNSECPFVKKHYDLSKKNMQKLQELAHTKGVEWITINSSGEGKEGYLKDREAAFKVINKYEMKPSHFVLDHKGIIGKFFGAKVTPHMFIINGQGKLAYMGAIDSIKSTDVKDVDKIDVKRLFADSLNEVVAGKAPKVAVSEEYGCGVKYSN
ncbi:MAG: redoxin family protein [Bacteriovoracaceae bacterium]|nr:redoxin family protein [Bacteriovoracaceae bacterium]